MSEHRLNASTPTVIYWKCVQSSGSVNNSETDSKAVDKLLVHCQRTLTDNFYVDIFFYPFQLIFHWTVDKQIQRSKRLTRLKFLDLVLGEGLKEKISSGKRPLLTKTCCAFSFLAY